MFPGYKHVEAFGADAEYEEEVEIEYVTLDLGRDVHRELLPNASQYRLIGLDTATPLLQVSETIFRGAHEQLVGTELLFTDGRDESDLARKFVVPVGTTEKRIKFEQVEVKAKTAEGKSTENEKEKERGKKGKAADKRLAYGESLVDLSTS